ncbi:MAG: primosomal protein [Gammaproteobacteria bacterium]|jgi:primosomal protein N' (replication factor Y)|nr:primosomal protein [Gammaproteobacteria bacterium]
MPVYILQVAVPSPLRKCLAYLPPKNCSMAQLIPGIRIQVPLRNRQVIGVLTALTQQTDYALDKLKTATALIDDKPLIPLSLMQLINWGSVYYQWPIGDAFSTALPALFRQGKPAVLATLKHWQLTESGWQIVPEELTRAPLQAKALKLLREQPTGLTKTVLHQAEIGSNILRSLLNKDWIKEVVVKPTRINQSLMPKQEKLALNPAQQQAVAEISAQLKQAKTFLLDGVTGSGKTEIYLQVIAEVIKHGQQALILVPEINLTPQTVERFRARFNIETVVLHSNLTDNQRLTAWLQAQTGAAPIVIGTRSAIFTPLAKPGIIIVDEEHDASFKQQDSFRYCARDLAVMRGKLENIPVVLGSATPCLESLNNALKGRYQHLTLPERAGNAKPPTFRALDLRGQVMQEGLSGTLLTVMEKHLKAGNQVLVFLNRRGYAPVLICHHCGWIAGCKHCSAHLTLHQNFLQCHHCASQQPIYRQCPSCQQTKLIPVGIGTQRIEKILETRFPKAGVLRIDRDSTRRKNAMETILHQINSQQKRILIGTQMLAKGHHFPHVTLVAILDTDAGLFSSDFRASEHLAQLLMQVAGRAGRAEKPGEVLLQTYHPEHPLLQILLTIGYLPFAKHALQERQMAQLPPFSHLALLRAEAMNQEMLQRFMQEICNFVLQQQLPIQLQGPVIAPLERKAGHYRMQLLFHALQRQTLNAGLKQIISHVEQHKASKKIRWSVDVDPINLF